MAEPRVRIQLVMVLTTAHWCLFLLFPATGTTVLQSECPPFPRRWPSIWTRNLCCRGCSFNQPPRWTDANSAGLLKETRQQEVLLHAGLMLNVEVSLFPSRVPLLCEGGKRWRSLRADGALTDTFPSEAGTQLWSSCSQKEFNVTFAVLVLVDICHNPLRASGDTSIVDGGETTRF